MVYLLFLVYILFSILSFSYASEEINVELLDERKKNQTDTTFIDNNLASSIDLDHFEPPLEQPPRKKKKFKRKKKKHHKKHDKFMINKIDIQLEDKGDIDNPQIIEFIPGGGRLGDQLLQYIKAKWISINNNIPLYIPKSDFFENLVLSSEELSSCIGFRQDHHKVSYYPTLTYSKIMELKQNEFFMSELRRLIAPKVKLNLIEPPEDMISIGLHIRKEYGFSKTLKSVQIYDLNNIRTTQYNNRSKTHMDLDFPEKFPPEQFFIDQVKYLSEHFNHKPIYLFIFTDEKDVGSLVARLSHEIDLSNITYEYRDIEELNSDQVILEDFFSMMNFDCLVRPKLSYFSLIAEMLGKNKIVIFPETFHWEATKDKGKVENLYLVIDKVKIQESIE